MPKSKRSPFRSLECALLYVGLPILLYKFQGAFTGLLLVILGGAALAALSFLLVDPTFHRRRLWNFKHVDGLPFMRFIPPAIAIGLLIWIVWPERLFELPRDNIKLWFLVVVAYPLVSVYPQEVLFRAFFCHRYRSVFGRRLGLVLANALCFAWVHILFGNWVAPLLCFFGGLLFVETYRRTRSLACASLEHAIWGVFVISIGLSEFFLDGGISEIEKWLMP